MVYILHFNHILTVKNTPVKIRNRKIEYVENVWLENSALLIYN